MSLEASKQGICMYCYRSLIIGDPWKSADWVHVDGMGSKWQCCKYCGFEGSRVPMYDHCPECRSVHMVVDHSARRVE